MQSISLIRFLQVIIVLVQLSALFLVSDLCTTFEPAKLSKSCVHTLADKNVTEAHELSTAEMNTTTPAPELTFGVQRYCLPLGITDLISLFNKEDSWNAISYVLLYTAIWLVLALVDLVFAVLFCLEKQNLSENTGGRSLSFIACILELCVLASQIIGAFYAYNSWTRLWENEYFTPRFPLNFHVGFAIAAICLLMVVFEEFVGSPRLYFIRRNDADSNENDDEVQQPPLRAPVFRSGNSLGSTQKSVSTGLN